MRSLWLVVFACSLLAASSAHGQGATASLRRLLESGRVPPERQGAIVEMLVTRGAAEDLAFAFEMLQKPEALAPETRRKVVSLLADAATNRNVRPSGDLSSLAGLIEGDAAAADPALQLAAIRLAGAWKLENVAGTLQKIATSENASPALQQAALQALVEIGGDASRQTIGKLAREAGLIATRVRAVAALARIELPAAVDAAAAVLAGAQADDDIGPMLDAILSRKEGADALAAALDKQPPPADAAKLALRYIYSIGRSDQALSDVLSKAAGIALDAPPPSQEEVKKIVAQVAAHGDAARGEQIFRRADLSCMKCHAVAGAGGVIGPDLSPVGSISPPDYIVNSILNPNLAIKEQYVTRRVLTLDGEVFTGIQVDRDDQVLRLRDATGKLHAIPIDNIDQEGEGKSLMPQGLTKFLTEQEFLDLARFVSELGKPGPYAIRKTPSIQRWRVLREPPPELLTETPNVEILREQVLDAPAEAWATAYGTVGGDLPLAELTAQRPAVIYVQGELNVVEAGVVSIDIQSTEPLHAWLDAEPFENPTRIERELTAGKHTLTLRIEVSASADPKLKVELTKPADSTAQFVVVNGA